MPRPVSVLFVHGIGVDKADFADGMQTAIEVRLKKLSKFMLPQTVFWGDIVRPQQKAFFARARSAAKLEDNEFRRLALQGLGDAAAYQKTPSRLDAPYYKIQAKVREGVEYLEKLDDPQRPLVVIGHSLGCHILSSFIWDANTIKQLTPEELGKRDARDRDYHSYLTSGSLFRRLDTLAGIVTMGSNMPLFTFTFEKKDVTPITKARPGKTAAFPGRALDAATVGKAKWLNYYSINDLLAYPLRPLYDLDDKEKLLHDVPVVSEGFFGSMIKSPLNAFSAHTRYFSNRTVIKGSADLIRDIITAGDAKPA